MSQLKKIFSLQELLQTSQAISQDKKEGKKDFKAYAVKIEQLVFYFDAGFSSKEIVENIEEIIQQLSKIIEAGGAYSEEVFSSAYVPREILEYWQDEAEKAAKTRKEIESLVEQKIAAWITGLKETYAKEHKEFFPEGKVPQKNLLWYLENRKREIEATLEKGERRIRKNLSPFEKRLTKLTSKTLAQELTEEISRSPEIENEESFREKLREFLKGKVVEEKIPEIVEDLSSCYPEIAQALNIRGTQREQVGSQTDVESATNLEALPEEIVDQLEPEPGKTKEDAWTEITSWWRAQGYPGQTLLALAKAEPGLFKGGFKEVIKNIKDALIPGFPLQSQLLWILSASKEELLKLKATTFLGGWETLFGEGSLKEIEPETGERLKRFLEEIEKGLLPVTFEQKEKLSLYVHLLENIEKIERFAQAHPYLGGSLRLVGKAFAFPIRHQNITLIYQLSKFGPYAPRVIIEELLFKRGLQFAWRSLIVKTTERFRWGWTTKHIPFIGTKVVWKPLEAAKRWTREKLSGVFARLGLKKLAAVIAGAGVIGTLIVVFKEPIKKALKVLGGLFLVLLNFVAQYGPVALTVFGLTTVAGAVGGVIVGAKIGGILGALILGPIGGFLGALLGAGIVYLGWTKLLPLFTAPAAAEVVGGAGALPVIDLAPYAAVAGATPVVIGALAAGTIFLTSSAFIIPEEEVTYGSKYIQIQKGFDINGEPQDKFIFENEEIIGKNLNYGFKVTIVEKTLNKVVVNDKLEIIKKDVTVFRNETHNLGKMEPGASKHFDYSIKPDDRFKDSYISNTVTVTSEEGEVQTLTLTLTVGQPPVPGSVALARKIIDTLLACSGLERKLNGVVVNKTSWPIAKGCLQKAAIPPNVIDILGRFQNQFFNLQCVHFVVAATSGDLPSKPGAKDYCTQSTPGYSLSVRWEDVKPGDIIASSRGKAGHVAMVVAPPFKNSNGEILYVEVAEAMGDTGVVQYRRPTRETLLSRYCGYLRKGG